MYEIAIIGDLHVDTKVSSRRDDYFLTCLNKIEEVCNVCKNIIILGDVFNRPVLPNNYFIAFYNTLMNLKLTNGNNFYAIMGNHDLYNENEESLQKTVLGLCEATGIITVIKPNNSITISNYNFHTSYVNLKRAKEHLKGLNLQPNDILLLHHYFEDKYEGLVYDDIKDLKCSKIFLGHEHLPFTNLRKDYSNFTIFRCGSFLRNSAGKSNFERSIYYYILDNNTIKIGSLETMESALEVFTEKAFNQENLKRKQFLDNINEVIDKYKNNVGKNDKFSIQQILQELNAPMHVYTYLKSKYNAINEQFN